VLLGGFGSGLFVGGVVDVVEVEFIHWVGEFEKSRSGKEFFGYNE
jgi:hypothetical protein